MTKAKIILINNFILIILFFIGTITTKANNNNNTPPQHKEKEFIYYTKKNSSEFNVKHKGKILVNELDNDITSISQNGYLIIEQSSFGNTRKIEFTSDASGKLTKKYLEGKQEGDYTKEGAEWFKSLMPDLIYQTAIGGSERVLRIYKNKGMRTALLEAEKLRTKGGKSSTIIVGYYKQEINYSITNHNLYYKAIVDNIQMTNDELSEYLQSLSNMKSNSNKGSILRLILNKYKLDTELMEDFLKTTASLEYNTERGNTLRSFISKYEINKDNYRDFFRVIDGMNINSEKGNVLKPILDKQNLEDNIFIALLESVRNFTNNSEKAAVLRKAINKLPENQMVTDAFVATNNSMSSPYRLLKEEINNMLLDKNYFKNNTEISKELMISTMQSVRNESANTKKTTTLRKIHSSMNNDPKLIEAYFQVVESMDNTVESYNLILEFMESVKMNTLSYIAIYVAAEEIAKKDNKHAASAILRASIPNMPNDKEVIIQFFDALEEIDHNSSREEIIRLLAQHKKASTNEGFLLMLKIAGNIDMDIEKAFALSYINKIIPKNNNEAIFLHKRLCEEIELEYEYKRALGI